jgi:hypothetical protein
MPDRLAAHRPPTIRNLPTRTRRFAIGAAAVIPALLIGVLGSTHPEPPQDSGLVACAYPLSTQDVPATDYPKIRAEFAGSRWPDLRIAGTAYVDLAVQLPHARYTDGYETVWFYQRLSTACAKHRRLTAAHPGDRTRVRPDPRRPRGLAAPDTGIAVTLSARHSTRSGPSAAGTS